MQPSEASLQYYQSRIRELREKERAWSENFIRRCLSGGPEGYRSDGRELDPYSRFIDDRREENYYRWCAEMMREINVNVRATYNASYLHNRIYGHHRKAVESFRIRNFKLREQWIPIEELLRTLEADIKCATVLREIGFDFVEYTKDNAQ